MRSLNNDRAENPIEIVLTIFVWLLLLAGIQFAEGSFIDGFIHVISIVPISLTTQFQGMMGSVMDLALIFFAIPSFVGAVLIVWGVKSLYKKMGYSREQQWEEF